MADGDGGENADHQRPTRVDAHHHVWDLSVRDQPWTAGMPALRRSFSLDDLRPSLAANRVDQTVVVQTVCVPEETPELLALAAGAPEVTGVVGWADLCSPDIAENLAALRQLSGGSYLVGLRHQVQEEPDPDWLCRSDVRRGLQAVANAGLVYDLLVRHYQLPAAIETVAALDDLRFVIDHGAKPDIARSRLEPWRSQMIELGRRPNVAVKLSGLVTEADPSTWPITGGAVGQFRPYAEVILENFGAGRAMWGSDWPVCLLAASYEDVLAAAENFTSSMSASERSDVFGGTARTWYSLEGPHEEANERA
ncbi:MAG TPA: amidohydrolase family protein [Acidimicrobiales bacterium]|nr:amidohydrolase family protein [Acidimicrobiales bacterium]